MQNYSNSKLTMKKIVNRYHGLMQPM